MGKFIAGILIASLGAVMDVAMSISSTIEEISYQNPELGIKGLFFSGMRVGKDMMGTMSNTLILAFAGGSINTLVFIYAYNYEYLQMINMFDIGIEIIQGVASSMGVILTVPICSFLSACIQGKLKSVYLIATRDLRISGCNFFYLKIKGLCDFLRKRF